MRREIIIDGINFDDIEGFYCEIERLLTKDLDWQVGHGLDSFNDILRGGFGVHEYGEPIKIVWKNFNKSSKDLGFMATAKHYEQVLTRCHPSNFYTMQKRLDDAKNGIGKTLIDIIVDIILDTDDSGHDCKLEIIDQTT